MSKVSFFIKVAQFGYLRYNLFLVVFVIFWASNFGVACNYFYQLEVFLMMIKSLKRISFIFLIIFFVPTLLPSANRTAAFIIPDFSVQKIPREHQEGWISANICRANVSSGFDQFGDSGPLFCGFGTTNFDQMTRSYDYLKKWPKTADFIKTVCLDPNFSAEEKRLFCGGSAEIVDLGLLVSFPVGKNFSGFCELPFRAVKMKGLKFVMDNDSESDFAKLVNSKIDDVLAEHNFEKLSADSTLSGISDITVLIGWADKHVNNDSKVAVSSIGASIRAGIIIPSSAIFGFNRKFLYNIPLGENGSFGFKLQAEGEIEFRPFVSFIGSIDSRIFLRKSENLRVKITKEQQGLLFDPVASVSYDNGHFWRVGCAIKMGSPKIGLFALAGYSYSSKEVSQLFLNDAEYLRKQKRYVIKSSELAGITTSNIDTVVADNKCDEVYLSNAVVNLDNQLTRQHLHCAHVSFVFQPKVTGRFESILEGPDPSFEVSYSYPIYGKNYICAPFFSGTVGFGIKISF